MPRAQQSRRLNEIESMKKEAEQGQKDMPGFIESYRDFLEKWGMSRQTKKSRKSKHSERGTRSSFKTISSM